MSIANESILITEEKNDNKLPSIICSIFIMQKKMLFQYINENLYAWIEWKAFVSLISSLDPFKSGKKAVFFLCPFINASRNAHCWVGKNFWMWEFDRRYLLISPWEIGCPSYTCNLFNYLINPHISTHTKTLANAYRDL